MKIERRTFLGLLGAGLIAPAIPFPIPDDVDPIPAIDAPFDCLLKINGRDFSNLVYRMELQMECDEILSEAVFGDEFRTFHPGPSRSLLELEFYHDFATDRLRQIVESYQEMNPIKIEIQPEGSGMVYSGDFIVSKYRCFEGFNHELEPYVRVSLQTLSRQSREEYR